MSDEFRCTYVVKEDKWLPVLKQWSGMTPGERADVGENVRLIGRWHDLVTRCGVVIVESSDVCAVQRFVGRWNPYLTATIAPVV
ncbi:MAG: DUF3303 family protein, partial [Dehalococcoidia bacterium]